MPAPNPIRAGNFDQSSTAAPFAPGELLPDPLPADPFPFFKVWFDDAQARAAQPNPNAMTLATVDPDGRPSARIVLCKEIDPSRGAVVFFTNYESRKGMALQTHPHASVVFHWDVLDKQARIEGPITRCPAAESDAYFESRPWQSRIGAWASDQSRPIPSRAALVEKVAGVMRRHGLDPSNPPPDDAQVRIPRPPHWGGYRLWADRVEVWISGPGRLHERAMWARPLQPDADGFRGGRWTSSRLQP